MFCIQNYGNQLKSNELEVTSASQRQIVAAKSDYKLRIFVIQPSNVKRKCTQLRGWLNIIKNCLCVSCKNRIKNHSLDMIAFKVYQLNLDSPALGVSNHLFLRRRLSNNRRRFTSGSANSMWQVTDMGFMQQYLPFFKGKGKKKSRKRFHSKCSLWKSYFFRLEIRLTWPYRATWLENFAHGIYFSFTWNFTGCKY